MKGANGRPINRNIETAADFDFENLSYLCKLIQTRKNAAYKMMHTESQLLFNECKSQIEHENLKIKQVLGL